MSADTTNNRPADWDARARFHAARQRWQQVTLSALRGNTSCSTSTPKTIPPAAPPRRAASATTGTRWSSAACACWASAATASSRTRVCREVRPAIHAALDEGGEVTEKYGVWGEKSMYGKTFMGIFRVTFAIGPDGVIEPSGEGPPRGPRCRGARLPRWRGERLTLAKATGTAYPHMHPPNSIPPQSEGYRYAHSRVC